jgi:signal transduction histidine kinase
MHALGRTAALATTVRQAAAQRERDTLLLERIELAREVHESVMQRLFGVSMVLGSGRELSADDGERSAAEVEAALGELRDALDRSLEPTAEPSRTTLRDELRRLGRQYKALPLSVRWEQGTDVPPGLEPLAVSVLGEALRNAEKHARPSEVRITISSDHGVFALEVRNDGLRSQPASAGSGLGLRLASYESLQRGGMLEFGPEGDDWRVRLVLPAGDVAGVVGG